MTELEAIVMLKKLQVASPEAHAVPGLTLANSDPYDSDVSTGASGADARGTGTGASSPVAVLEQPITYVPAADTFAGMDLAAAMPRHKTRLEKDREAALLAKEPRRAAQRRVVEEQPSLDEVLVPHKSKLQKDKEAAALAAAPRRSPRSVVIEVPSLESVLVPHKSRLQKDKEAALEAAQPRRSAVRIDIHGTTGQQPPPLESMLKKRYFRLEQEKETISDLPERVPPMIATPRSRLQIELEAAKRLTEVSRAKQEGSKIGVTVSELDTVEEANVDVANDDVYWKDFTAIIK